MRYPPDGDFLSGLPYPPLEQQGPEQSPNSSQLANVYKKRKITKKQSTVSLN